MSTIPSFAQPSPEEKKLLFKKIDTLLINYIKFSRFVEDGRTTVTPKAVNDFKELFVTDRSMLQDGLLPKYFSRENTAPRIPNIQSMEVEALRLQGKVPLQKPTSKSVSQWYRFRDSLNAYFSDLETYRADFFKNYNELNLRLASYDNELKSQEDLVSRTLDEFLEIAQTRYADGISVRLLNSAVSFKNIEDNEVKLLVEKRTEGRLTDGSTLNLQSVDTLVLSIQVSDNYSLLKISNITVIGHHLNHLNDKDHDFLAGSADACPDESGLLQATGCPSTAEKKLRNNMALYLTTRRADSTLAFSSNTGVASTIKGLEAEKKRWEDLIAAPPKWVLTAGLNSGIVTGSLTEARLNYDGLINNDKGKLINPNTVFAGGKSFGGDVMVERFFGKKSNFGIGFGASFNFISGTLKKSDFHVEYREQDKRNDFYTQLISAKGPIEDNVSIQSFAIPFTAIYKGNVTTAIGFKIEGGVALNVFYRGKSSSSNLPTFKYEAAYRFLNQADSYYDDRRSNTLTGFDAGSFLMLENSVDQLNTAEKEKYFNDLASNDFNVGLNLAPTKTNGTSTFNPGISFIFRPSISINFSKAAWVNLGLYYTYTRVAQSGDYKLINGFKGQREYNSLLQGVSTMATNNFGIRITYSQALNYTLSKWKKELSGLL